MKATVAVLAVCMLVTGSINTIAIKLQDNVVVGEDEQGQPRTFKHPAVQTAFMFAGEVLCLVAFLVGRCWKHLSGKYDEYSQEEKDLRAHRFKRSFWLFMLPTICDAGATTLLNLGLFYTYASVYQMLRGTLVIFAGLLTVLLLKRRLHAHHWAGIVLIMAGAALVGASSIIYPPATSSSNGSSGVGDPATVGPGRQLLAESGGGPSSAPNPLLGDALVVLAQLLAATQFIVEERFLSKYHAPVLMAVGMEGFWGVLLSCVALPLLSRVPGPDGLPLDSLEEAITEIRASRTLQWTTLAAVTSIAFFNFFGVSVTKKLSGASRATIDACRTLLIWLFSLHMGWENFHMLQVVGFLVLVSGTSMYNEILRAFLPAPRRRRHRRRAKHEPGQAAADGGDALEQGSLQQPLLAGGQEEEGMGGEGRSGVVRFAPGTAPEAGAGEERGALLARPQPIRGRDRQRYSMARSITLLPGALSPHSLASLPTGLSYSDSLASGGVLQGYGASSSHMSGHGGSRALDRLGGRA